MSHLAAKFALVTLALASAAAQTRPTLVPLVWTQGQPEAAIRQAVREVAEGGNTGLVWESRPHPEYLGPRWWADLRVVVDEARKRGLDVWIFDEWMYPSGVAGDRVVAENPKFAFHTVEGHSIAVEGPAAERDFDIPRPVEGDLLSVVAFPERYDAARPPVTLRPAAGGTRVRWAVPEGRWRICWSAMRSGAPRPGGRPARMIDVMNPEATAAFIRITHEATYKHLGAEFGKTIKGFFSDESGFRNIASYDSLPGKPGMALPWSPVFAAYFQKVKGYDLTPWLPALWYDLGPRGRMARFDFVDVCSRALAEHFFKPQQEWCHAHGVKLIGHLVEDNHADHNLGYGPGHWFRAIRYLDMPGIDVVGYQVTPGIDSGNIAWLPRGGTLWDQEFFSFGLPAMARGAALIQGSREIFSEAFGANGWSEGLRMVKWIGDWHIVNGISVLSPHAYTMKYHDPDCPPHFNRMSGTPQWRYYRNWAGPFRRLQEVILASDPLYDAVVLYTAESAWAGVAAPTAPAVRALETSQLGTVVLPYETLAGEIRIEGGKWVVGGRRFGTIVLPHVRFVPGYVAQKLAQFAEAGGRVIALETWPEASVDARADDEVKAAVERLAKSRNAVLTTIWDLPAHFGPGTVTARPAMPFLVTARRQAGDEQWLILHNRSLASSAVGRIAVAGAPAHAALLDAETGASVAIPHRVVDGKLTIDIDMPPYTLWAVRLSKVLAKTERRPAWNRAEAFTPAWQVARAADDEARNFEPLGERSELVDWRRWPGMQSYAGTVRYRATLKLSATGGPVGLEAGRVEEIAELTVNGKPLGARIHPPYTWDISSAVRTGENEIVLEVTNTAQARWQDEFSHGDAVSGLLGPVRLLRAVPARVAQK